MRGVWFDGFLGYESVLGNTEEQGMGRKHKFLDDIIVRNITLV